MIEVWDKCGNGDGDKAYCEEDYEDDGSNHRNNQSKKKQAGRVPARVTSQLLLELIEEERAVLGGVAEFLVNPEELVVLADTVGAAGGACLDLADVCGDGEIGNDGIFGFTAAMAHDGGVAGTTGHVDGFEGLGECADLVYLNKDRIGTAEFDAFGESL